MKLKNFYTYKITFIPTGQFYFGARASNIEPLLDLGIRYFSSSKIVKKLLNENDKSLFLFEILEQYFSNWNECVNAEQQLIFDNWDSKLKLNKVCYFHRPGFGLMTEDVRQAISEASKKSWQNNREHILEAQRQGQLNPEVKIKKSEAAKKSWTDKRKEEHSKKMIGHVGSKKCLGVSKPQSHGQNVSNALKGKNKSEDHKKALSEAIKNLPILTCEYCGKTMNYRSFKRYHGDKCKSIHPSLKAND